jgi:hypothetical protein
MSSFRSSAESSDEILHCKDRCNFKKLHIAAGFLLLGAIAVVSCNYYGQQTPSSTSLSQLWESDESPNHDPYFNVFNDGLDESQREDHRHWSSEEVRERVWQTLKDLEAMEDHVKEQNALNYKLKSKVTELDEGITREHKIIRMLIDEGMSHVENRLKFIEEAVSSNVTAVKKTLRILRAEDREQQQRQDKTIDQLNTQHRALVASTSKQLQQVSAPSHIPQK